MSGPSNGAYRPALPPQPVLQIRDLMPHGGATPATLSDLPFVQNVSSGRAALAQILDICGIESGDQVLLPSYHCIAMVEPVLARGAEPIFFRMNRDLSPNMDSIQTRLAGRTRAVVVAHYFGLLQDLDGIAELCREQGIMLIEDCAHAYFGQRGADAVGSRGNYAIGSTSKFFALFDGGIVASRNDRAVRSARLSGAGPAFEIKAAINILERAVAANKLGALRPLVSLALGLKDILWGGIKGDKPEGGVATIAAAEGNHGFDAAWVYRRASIASRMVLRLSSRSRIAQARVRNYKLFAELLSGAPFAHCPFPILPEHTVPHLFPLYVNSLERLMPVILERKVPFQRFGHELWKGMNFGDCGVTEDYSRNLIQLPVHQALSRRQIGWIADQMLEILDGYGSQPDANNAVEMTHI